MNQRSERKYINIWVRTTEYLDRISNISVKEPLNAY